MREIGFTHVLILSLHVCCILNRGLLCGSLGIGKIKLDFNGITFGWMDAGCKFIVMKLCLMNKENALDTYYVVKLYIICFKILY